jgi:hypothetical protein
VDDGGSAGDDADPVGSVLGDNLVRYEEFRGFIVSGFHRRTSPDVKDVFVHNTTEATFGDVTAIDDTRWHPVIHNEVTQDRRINPNSAGITGAVSQQALLVFDVTLPGTDGGSVPCWNLVSVGIPFNCYPNIVGESESFGNPYQNWQPLYNVKIDLRKIRFNSPPTLCNTARPAS